MAEIVETREKDGRAFWVYDDGSEKWCDNGHFKAPPPAAMIKTSEQGLAMRERRTTLSQERTREGIAEGLGLDLNKSSGGDEWKTLTRLFVEQFAKSKNLRGMAESYEKLGRAAGYISQDNPDDNATLTTLKTLLQIFDKLEHRDTIEGKVIE